MNVDTFHCDADLARVNERECGDLIE
jgi:hypothetical protein